MRPLPASGTAGHHCRYSTGCDLGGEGHRIGVVVDHLVVLQGVAVHVIPARRPVEVASFVASQAGLCARRGRSQVMESSETWNDVNSKTATGDADCVGPSSSYHQVVHVAEAPLQVLIRSLC